MSIGKTCHDGLIIMATLSPDTSELFVAALGKNTNTLTQELGTRLIDGSYVNVETTTRFISKPLEAL